MIVFYSFLWSIPDVTVSMFSFFSVCDFSFSAYNVSFSLLHIGTYKVQASVVISCNVTDCFAFFLSFFRTIIYPLASCVWKHRQKLLCMCTSGYAEKIDFRRRLSLCKCTVQSIRDRCE